MTPEEPLALGTSNVQQYGEIVLEGTCVGEENMRGTLTVCDVRTLVAKKSYTLVYNVDECVRLDMYIPPVDQSWLRQQRELELYYNDQRRKQLDAEAEQKMVSVVNVVQSKVAELQENLETGQAVLADFTRSLCAKCTKQVCRCCMYEGCESVAIYRCSSCKLAGCRAEHILHNCQSIYSSTVLQKMKVVLPPMKNDENCERCCKKKCVCCAVCSAYGKRKCASCAKVYCNGESCVEKHKRSGCVANWTFLRTVVQASEQEGMWRSTFLQRLSIIEAIFKRPEQILFSPRDGMTVREAYEEYEKHSFSRIEHYPNDMDNLVVRKILEQVKTNDVAWVRRDEPGCVQAKFHHTADAECRKTTLCCVSCCKCGNGDMCRICGVTWANLAKQLYQEKGGNPDLQRHDFESVQGEMVAKFVLTKWHRWWMMDEFTKYSLQEREPVLFKREEEKTNAESFVETVKEVKQNVTSAVEGVSAFGAAYRAVQGAIASFKSSGVGQFLGDALTFIKDILATTGRVTYKAVGIPGIVLILVVLFRRRMAEFFDWLGTKLGRMWKFTAEVQKEDDNIANFLLKCWRVLYGSSEETEEIETRKKQRETVQSGLVGGGVAVVATAVMAFFPEMLKRGTFVDLVVSKSRPLCAALEMQQSASTWLIDKMPDLIKGILKDAGLYHESDNHEVIDEALTNGGVLFVLFEQGVMSSEQALQLLSIIGYLQTKLLSMTGDSSRAMTMAISTFLKRVQLKENELQELAKEANEAEPVPVYLYSAPGCSKSYTMDLANRILFPFNANPIYYRNTSDPYFSGLDVGGHVAYGIDDIGQNLKTISERAAEIIVMTGKCTFRPMMAGVDQKGISWKPRMIWVSSNLSIGYHIDGVDNNAFGRRFEDHTYEMECAADVLDNGVFSPEIFEQKDDNYKSEMRHLTFIRYKRAPTKGNSPKAEWTKTTEKYTFFQWLARIKYSLDRAAERAKKGSKSNEAVHEKFVNYLVDNACQSLVDERKDPDPHHYNVERIEGLLDPMDVAEQVYGVGDERYRRLVTLRQRGARHRAAQRQKVQMEAVDEDADPGDEVWFDPKEEVKSSVDPAFQAVKKKRPSNLLSAKPLSRRDQLASAMRNLRVKGKKLDYKESRAAQLGRTFLQSIPVQFWPPEGIEFNYYVDDNKIMGDPSKWTKCGGQTTDYFLSTNDHGNVEKIRLMTIFFYTYFRLALHVQYNDGAADEDVYGGFMVAMEMRNFLKAVSTMIQSWTLHPCDLPWLQYLQKIEKLPATSTWKAKDLDRLNKAIDDMIHCDVDDVLQGTMTMQEVVCAEMGTEELERLERKGLIETIPAIAVVEAVNKESDARMNYLYEKIIGNNKWWRTTAWYDPHARKMQTIAKVCAGVTLVVGGFIGMMKMWDYVMGRDEPEVAKPSEKLSVKQLTEMAPAMIFEPDHDGHFYEKPEGDFVIQVQSNEFKQPEFKREKGRVAWMSRWKELNGKHFINEWGHLKVGALEHYANDAWNKFASGQTVQMETTTPDSQTTMQLQKIENAIVIVDVAGRHVRGTIVRGRTMLTNRHVFVTKKGDLFPNGTRCSITGTGFTIDFKFDESKLQQYKVEMFGQEYSQDHVLYELPEKMINGQPLPVFPDITGMFINDFDAFEAKRYRNIVALTPEFYDNITTHVMVRFGVEYEASIMESVDGNEKTRFCVPKVLVYKKYTAGKESAALREGDCGSPIVAIGRGGSVNILGIHVAKRLVREGATPVEDEYENVGIPIHKDVVRFQQYQVQGSDCVPIVELKPGFDWAGRIKEAVPALEKVTVFEESLLANDPVCRSVTERPAIQGLAQSDYTNEQLLKKELNRAEPFPVSPEEHISCEVSDAICAGIFERLEKAWDVAFRDKVHLLPEQVVLSGGAAVCATCGGKHKGLQPINLDTASGYYHGLRRGARGKKHLIHGNAGEREITCGLLRGEIQELRERLKDPDLLKDRVVDGPMKGMPRFMLILQLFTKDELRSAAKTDPTDPITRNVSIFPVVHTILSREYFGAFIDFMHQMFDRLPSAVGMNVNSPDWDNMIRQGLRVGSKGVDIDWKKFEGVWQEFFAVRYADMVNKWYEKHDPAWKPEDDVVRKNLVMLAVNNLLLIGRELYTQRGQLKSGVSMTTLCGGFMNEFLMGYSFIDAMGYLDRPAMGMQQFYAHVFAKFFSDDNIQFISDLVIDRYNYFSIKKTLNRLGYTITPASKDGEEVASKPYTELEFLKQKTEVHDFVPGSQYYAVPSDLEKRATLKWVRKSDDPAHAVWQNAYAYVTRLWGKGPIFYESVRRQVEGALVRNGVRGDLPVWSECRERYLDGSLGFRMIFEPGEFVDMWGSRKLFMPEGWDQWLEGVLPPRTRVPVRHQRRVGRYLIWGVPGYDEERELSEEEEKSPRKHYVQMLAPDSDAPPTVVTVGQPGSTNPGMENPSRIWSGKDTLGSLMKRYVPVLSQNGSQPDIYLSSLAFPNTTGANRRYTTTIHYLLAPYAFYWTGWRFKMDQVDAVDAGYRTAVLYPGLSVNGDVQSMYNQFYYGSGVANKEGSYAGAGVYMRSVNNISGIQSFAMEPWADVQMFRVPVNQSMISTSMRFVDQSRLTVRIDGGGLAASRIFYSTGDAPCAIGLREVPHIKVGDVGRFKVQMAEAAASSIESHAGVSSVVAAVPQEAESVRQPTAMSDYGAEGAQYSMEQMAERTNFIHNVTWATTDTFGKLATWQVPADLIGGSAAVPFNNFLYWNGPVRVRIDVTSSYTQVGMCILYFVPDFSEAMVDVKIADSLQDQIVNQHVFMLAGAPRSYLFEIPYLHPLLRFDTSKIGEGWLDANTLGLGTLVLGVVNPLIVPAGSLQTIANLAVYVEFPKPQGGPAFSILRQIPLTTWGPSTRARKKALGLMARKEERKDDGFEVVTQAPRGVDNRRRNRVVGVSKAVVQGGAFSAMTKTASNVVKVAGKVVDVADGLAGALNVDHDKPMVAHEPMGMVQVPMIDIATTIGVVQGVHLGARSDEVRIVSPQEVGSSTDELSIGHWLSLWNFDETFTIHPASDGFVWEMAMMPTPILYGSSTTTTYSVGPTEYISHLFEYWRAEALEIKFQVVRNRVTGCKVWVTPVYNGTFGALPSIVEATAAYGTSLDLADGQTEYIVPIPFRSDRKWYPIPHQSPTTGETSVFAPCIVQMYILNQLVQDPTVPDYIYVNVYYRFRNLEFMFPGDGISYFRNPLTYNA